MEKTGVGSYFVEESQRSGGSSFFEMKDFGTKVPSRAVGRWLND